MLEILLVALASRRQGVDIKIVPARGQRYRTIFLFGLAKFLRFLGFSLKLYALHFATRLPEHSRLI